MGIRVHKALGYALVDVQTDGHGYITDPRINAKSPLIHWRENKPKGNLESYMKFLSKKIAAEPDNFDIKMDLQSLRNRVENPSKIIPDPYRAATHEFEGGLANVLMLTPINDIDDWKRTDDIIDYYEDHLNNPEYEGSPTIRLIKDGIYPYSGSYVNARTAETIKWARLDVLKFVRRAYEEGTTSKAEYQTFIEKIGFESEADMDANLCPKIPESVKLLIEWGKLFVSSETIYQLRPYVYTYWN